MAKALACAQTVLDDNRCNMTPHEVRAAHQRMTELRLRSSGRGSKKFSLGTRESAFPVPAAARRSHKAGHRAREEERADRGVTAFADRENECIRIARGSVDSTSSLTFRNLKNCQVLSLSPNRGTGIFECEDSSFYFGAVDGPLRSSQCNRCSFAAVSRQLRATDCVNVTFWVDSLSAPVIEKTKAAVFSNYIFDFPEMENDLGATMGTTDLKASREVRDFDWHRQQASPNWRKVVFASPVFRLSEDSDVAAISRKCFDVIADRGTWDSPRTIGTTARTEDDCEFGGQRVNGRDCSVFPEHDPEGTV
eukprot:Polyplicarium_translucidae@DN2874_c0_g1_i1.p1